MSTDWQSLLAKTRSNLEHAPGFSSGPINVGDGERAVSAGAGLALVGYGLKRRDGWGIASALGGLALLHRGYTGYCAVNDLLGRDSAGREALGNGVEASRALRVDAPADAVFAAWEDAGGLPTLLAHLDEVHRLDERSARFSPRLAVQALGLPEHFDCERLVHDSRRALVWRTPPGQPIRFELLVEVEELADGTSRMELAVHYSAPSGVSPRRLSPDLGPLLDEDLGRAGAVLAGLTATRETEVVSPEDAEGDDAEEPPTDDGLPDAASLADAEDATPVD